jgi:flagellar hook-associated protein FlgK
MAVGLAKVINDIHKEGYALDGSQGENFFIFQDESGAEIDLTAVDWNDPFSSGLNAGNIYINSSIASDVSNIAAGQRIEVGVYKESTAELPPEADNIFDQFNTELTSRGIGAADTISFEIHSEYLDSDENLQTFDETFSFQPGSTALSELAEDINSRNMGLTANYDSENNIFKLSTENKGSDVKLEVVSDNDSFISNDGDSSILKLELNTAVEYTGGNGLFLKGNGDTASQIAVLKDANLVFDEDAKTLQYDDIGETSFANFYKDLVAEIGVAAQESERMAENQEILVKHLEKRRESISGVSLDEEMANMVRFQHAFQANARVISVMDELLNTVVNGLKR